MTMRAVVVYESMYGNAHLVADAIGVGLRAAVFDVNIVSVSQAGPAVLADADLVVVGGPTHAHGMSGASTRKTAVQAVGKPSSSRKLEPDALGLGLREWFGSLGYYPAKAAAFDTRLRGPAALTGRASTAVARLLRARLRGRCGAGELPGDKAGPARAPRAHPCTRVGNHVGHRHRAEPRTRRRGNRAVTNGARAAAQGAHPAPADENGGQRRDDCRSAVSGCRLDSGKGMP
jgi:hypothetical protein